MSANTLRDLFMEQLKDVNDAEQRLTKALPKMAKAAHSEDLKSAFTEHLAETEEQVRRIAQVFETLGETVTRKTCRAMVGLLEEGEEIMKEEGDENVHDAGLIAAAQKVEHYEMATYGCLRTWAEQMGEEEAAQLLQTTLDEEGAADHRLTEIAQSLDVEATAASADEARMGDGKETPAKKSAPKRKSSAKGRTAPAADRSEHRGA